MGKLTHIQEYKLQQYKDNGFNWIARDKNGLLCMYVKEPILTKEGIWNNTGTYSDYEVIEGSIFTFIDGTEELPTLISDLLNWE